MLNFLRKLAEPFEKDAEIFEKLPELSVCGFKSTNSALKEKKTRVKIVSLDVKYL